MASLLKLSCNIDDAVAQVRALNEQQLPYILARSLTKVAKAAQDQVKLTVDRRFTTRNEWTRQNIKITPATKSTQTSEVYTDTGNRKTGAPDYLPRQEDGGEKVPYGGHKYLAIPTTYLWRYTPKSRPLPDNLRPTALLPAGANVGESFSGQFSAGSRSNGTHKVITRRTLRKLGNGQFVAFLQRTKAGTLCIFVRHGGMGYQGARDAEPWFILVRSAHVQARFGMEQTVKETVEYAFEEIFVDVAKEVGVEIKLS